MTATPSQTEWLEALDDMASEAIAVAAALGQRDDEDDRLAAVALEGRFVDHEEGGGEVWRDVERTQPERAGSRARSKRIAVRARSELAKHLR